MKTEEIETLKSFSWRNIYQFLHLEPDTHHQMIPFLVREL